jgi:hypothetical protein
MLNQILGNATDNGESRLVSLPPVFVRLSAKLLGLRSNGFESVLEGDVGGFAKGFDEGL